MAPLSIICVHVVRAEGAHYGTAIGTFHALCVTAAGVKLHESGWAWVVAGAKMLLWRYSALQTTVSVHNYTVNIIIGVHLKE